MLAVTPRLTAGLKEQFQPLLESDNGVALAINFWRYLRNFEADVVSEFDGFSLLFDRNEGCMQLNEKAPHSMLEAGSLGESLLSTLEFLGGHIAHADVVAAMSGDAKAVVMHPPSPVGVLAVLNACTNIDAALTTEMRELLFKYFTQESHKLSDDENMKASLRKLPIYELIEKYRDDTGIRWSDRESTCLSQQ